MCHTHTITEHTITIMGQEPVTKQVLWQYKVCPACIYLDILIQSAPGKLQVRHVPGRSHCARGQKQPESAIKSWPRSVERCRSVKSKRIVLNPCGKIQNRQRGQTTNLQSAGSRGFWAISFFFLKYPDRMSFIIHRMCGKVLKFLGRWRRFSKMSSNYISCAEVFELCVNASSSCEHCLKPFLVVLIADVTIQSFQAIKPISCLGVIIRLFDL